MAERRRPAGGIIGVLSPESVSGVPLRPKVPAVPIDRQAVLQVILHDEHNVVDDVSMRVDPGIEGQSLLY